MINYGFLAPLIFYKTHNFLYQHLSFNDSKPSSGQSFSVEVPLMASVIAKAALYWMYLNFCWKDSIKALS